MSPQEDKKVIEAEAQAFFEEITIIGNEARGDINAIEAKMYLQEITRKQDEWTDLKSRIIKVNLELEKREKINTSVFESVRTVLRTITLNAMKVLEAPLASTEPPASPASEAQTVQANYRLPNIDLKKFNGDLKQWEAFMSTFNSVIDTNPNLSKVHKLHYLSSCLQGEPFVIVSQYGVNEQSYDLAMAALRKRYSSKRLLINLHLEAIMDFKGDKNIGKFLETHRAAIGALRALLDEELSNYLLFQLTYANMATGIQQSFEAQRGIETLPTIEELLEFLEKTAKIEALKKPITKNASIAVWEPTKRIRSVMISSHGNENQNVNSGVRKEVNPSHLECPICRTTHKLHACDEFRKMSTSERRKLVEEHKRCFNCLGVRHTAKICLSKIKCASCQKRHHNLLHLNESEPSTSAANLERNFVGCASKADQNQKGYILLGTIQCEVRTNNGWIKVRCLVDNGAQTSIITKTLAEKIGYHETQGTVGGIADMKTPTMGTSRIHLRSANGQFKSVDATVMNQICHHQPTMKFENREINKLKLKLADPLFNTPRPIDVLLGCGVYNEILSTEEPTMIRTNAGLTAINTVFGYVLSGAVQAKALERANIYYTETLDNTLEKFWQVEEVEVRVRSDPETELCEEIFQKTTKRLPNGKYIVQLPFKEEVQPDKIENRVMAIRNYQMLDKKLSSNPELSKAYHEQMREYLELGHMKKYDGSEGPSRYLMPQLIVKRDHATTTKMRVVFNASAVSNYIEGETCTFNDLLMAGPKLQTDLTEILTRFRLNEIAITADVKMMFRMINVSPEHRKYQRIFYAEEGKIPEEYEIQVLLFGEKSAPYLAQRVMKQLVTDEGKGIDDITGNFYVDDYVEAVPTVELAIQRRKEITLLMEKGGFVLRKWLSSHPEVLEEVSNADFGKIDFSNNDGKAVKILGLIWEPQHGDVFSFKIKKFDGNVNKRTCLSYIARTFDCLGLVCPVVFWMKIFVKQLWIAKLSWDDPLPENLEKEWKKFTANMAALENLKIPRCIKQNGSTKIQLVGFSDGSSKGYAACVYLVVSYQDGRVTSNLLKAKSKVSPVKTISIPRIELCGFLLLGKLCQTVKIKVESTYMFTDSKIVLSWMLKPPHTLETFVANRVTKLLAITEGIQCRHVKSELNPADCASRGMDPSSMVNNQLWWAGPSFLTVQPSSEWGTAGERISDELPELKRKEFIMIVREPKEEMIQASTWTRQRHVMAYVLRFVHNATKPKNDKHHGALSAEEINEAEIYCIRTAQHEAFAKNVKPLKKLSPFIDEKGILRVGGRLKNSQLSYAEKHPIIIDKKSNLAKLIVSYYHRILLHAGPKTTQYVIQRKYWIVAAHQLIRQQIRKCNVCARWNASIQPMMGQLPETRVTVARPFTYTATDFAGPFTTKETTRRKSPMHKSYMCLFVCETTKAVHLEAVTALTTQAFIAALQRFAAIRGLPRQIRSDNGRNYVGASRYLVEIGKFLADNEDKIHCELRSLQINWKFNPSYASHFGGLFEAGVKQAKLFITRNMGVQVWTFEEFLTLLYRIQAILNSRPIVAPTADSTDGPYLTPSHFLIGDIGLAIPEAPLDLERNLSSRWDRMQQMTQRFWTDWSKSYLHTLTQKGKWQKANCNLKVGTIVYISDIKTTSPMSWPLGRVTKLFPGKDGVVRVAEVKVGGKLKRRAVNKLIVQPDN